VVEADDLAVAAGEKQLLAGASFALDRGEHVALVGPNGSGKTTLVETILGRREPQAGFVRLGHGVTPALFSQHTAELDERGSVLDATVRATRLSRPEAQTLLGRFLFSGWEAHEKPVTALSGGERRRLALALVVASGANFLLLDEPTNHLDVESREALEAALDAFPGSLLLVSHDRALVDAVASRTLAIEDRTLRSYEGGWAEYAERRAERLQGDVEAKRRPPPGRAAKRGAAPPTRDALAELEGRIEAQEQALETIERELAADWGNAEAVARHRLAREELARLVTRWEALVDEVAS
jgi:ATP-binding cassette subfamily F protein 3